MFEKEKLEKAMKDRQHAEKQLLRYKQSPHTSQATLDTWEKTVKDLKSKEELARMKLRGW